MQETYRERLDYRDFNSVSLMEICLRLQNVLCLDDCNGITTIFPAKTSRAFERESKL